VEAQTPAHGASPGRCRCKAVLDLLAAHGLIEDDANVLKVTASWDNATPPGTVRVTVEPAMVMAYANA
jgi:hypothetical protein